MAPGLFLWQAGRARRVAARPAIRLCAVARLCRALPQGRHSRVRRPPCFCFCAKPCRGASLFRQAPLFLMRVSDISFPALLERVKSFRSQY